MGFYVANEQKAVAGEPRLSPQAKPEIPLKKSRLEFFSSSSSRAGLFASQPLETHWETEPTPAKTASGMSFFLSRDPMGELGGLNLYGSFGNNPINFVDLYGLVTAGETCCCKPPASIKKFEVTDNGSGGMMVRAKVAIELEGCYADEKWMWWTCTRGPGGQWGFCLDRGWNTESLSIFVLPWYSPLIVNVKLWYLSCEDYKWVRHSRVSGEVFNYSLILGWRPW